MNSVIRIEGEIVTPLPGANITSEEPGVYSVLLDGLSYEVRISGNLITVNGLQMRWERENPREWKGGGQAAGAKGRASILAPMPGKIVKVLVALGDQVGAGQGILFIEAMKMQNELKSPKAGRVVSLEVQAHDSVTAGTVLAVVE